MDRRDMLGTSRVRSSRRRSRRGAILIWFALLIVLLLGMVGLVIDVGLMFSAQRQAQNAADAAALAAAYDLFRGQTNGAATTTANTFVRTHNGLPSAAVVVHIPPASGHYTGEPHFVEVTVSAPLPTYFIHVLPGVSQTQTVGARAVAGFESVTAGEGVAVLNPNARPGLYVGGGGFLRVLGNVYVNSEGGGVDENGAPSLTSLAGKTGFAAARGGTTGGLFASHIDVVGGVDNPTNFRNIDPGGSPDVLTCNSLPFPDPLLSLPTPKTSNGVDPSNRGTVDATNQNLAFNDPSGKNQVRTVNGLPTLVLYPGVYKSISITGGNVRFYPGIFVLAPTQNITNSLKITGGNVTAEGIMFYNTGNSYNPVEGTPDINDKDLAPPGKPSDLGDTTDYWGAFQFNAGMKFSPIDRKTWLNAGEWGYGNYTNTNGIQGPIPAVDFDGMLFYQRRRNDSPMSVAGDSSSGMLKGTLYARWAGVQISGQGTYDAQFVVGSISVTGQGNVTINYAGQNLGKAPAVFLVE